jgi:mRNA-degrading endonuclease RelE of RelBE toxin-antitoxin system
MNFSVHKQNIQYEIQMKPQAIKDAKRIPKIELKRIFAKIEELKEGLQGDITR